MEDKITTLVHNLQEYGQTMGVVASHAVVFGVLPTLICQLPVVSRMFVRAGKRA